MTNAEKYLKDGVDIKEFNKELFKNCVTGELFNYINTTAVINWLNSEVKPTLSEDEKVILRNLEIQKFKVIEKRENCLYVWKEGTHIPIEILFSHLFQFIQPRGRI